MASSCFQSLFFLLIFMASISTRSASAHVAGGEAMRPVQVAGGEAMRPVGGLHSKLVSESLRRKLGSFKLCANCTCCQGPKGPCSPSRCCHVIKCNLPNKPFGFCSFTPQTCNCSGCDP